jgi:hypothetical protein
MSLESKIGVTARTESRVVPEKLVRFDNSGFANVTSPRLEEAIVIYATNELAPVEQGIVDITAMLEQLRVPGTKKKKRQTFVGGPGWERSFGGGDVGDGGAPAGKEIAENIGEVIKGYGPGREVSSVPTPKNLQVNMLKRR